MDKELFKENVVTCPSCKNVFLNNKINGLALIDATQRIEARKRMYCKLSLDDIEKFYRASIPVEYPLIKKVILDNFNDFNRDIQTILGLGEDVE